MSERWTAVDGQLVQPDGWSAGYMHDRRLSADIAARLNGPSPAEVAALLRSVEWSSLEGSTEGSYGYNRCPSCEGFEPKHADDCKFDAMIKQCEEA